MTAHSQQFLQRRRFLTVLPLIVLPFLAVLFWLLGGSSGAKAVVPTKNGLNTQLPDANLKNQSPLDKLSFYVMADRDSVKRAEQRQMDPNYQQEQLATKNQKSVSGDEPDEAIHQKVYQLQRKVEEPVYKSMPENKKEDGDIERLQSMVQRISQKKVDPEIEALNGTLDKLLEIQNPGRKTNENIVNARRKVYAVSANGVSGEQNYFGNGSAGNTNGFLSDTDDTHDSLSNGTILAVVHNEQTLLAGSVVKLRLLQDVFVDGERIPVGSFVFGNSSIDNERLKVTVTSIQFQNRLYPVSLILFDMDGLEGINIPGSAGREVAKQSADQGIQSLGGLSFDPSLKAQAAAAGVNAAKTLFSKNVKQVRVTVKAGYRVLLKDENNKSKQ